MNAGSLPGQPFLPCLWLTSAHSKGCQAPPEQTLLPWRQARPRRNRNPNSPLWTFPRTQGHAEGRQDFYEMLSLGRWLGGGGSPQTLPLSYTPDSPALLCIPGQVAAPL